MKIAAAAIAFTSFASAAFAMPSTNNFHAVTNDWYNARFTNVYELASSRLSSNLADVVGSYLMLDWDLAFSDYATISNSMMRVVANSDNVTTPSFTNAYGMCRSMCIDFCREYLSRQSETNRVEAQMNSRQPHGFMTNELMLKILWDEGLW